MNIYITGDTHGDIARRIAAFYTDIFNVKFVSGDILIVCGDFGVPWRDEDKDILKFLEKKPIEILFVDGNHENFDLLNTFAVCERYGGKVHQLAKNVFHLMRGEVYEIAGKSFFAFGGATSVDKMYRALGVSWWPEEDASLKDEENALQNLSKCGYEVDYVITHTAPIYFVNPKVLDPRLNVNCPTANFLKDLEKRLKYKHCFFGHHHYDEKYDMERRHTCLYGSIVNYSEVNK